MRKRSRYANTRSRKDLLLPSRAGSKKTHGFSELESFVKEAYEEFGEGGIEDISLHQDAKYHMLISHFPETAKMMKVETAGYLFRLRYKRAKERVNVRQ